MSPTHPLPSLGSARVCPSHASPGTSPCITIKPVLMKDLGKDSSSLPSARKYQRRRQIVW